MFHKLLADDIMFKLFLQNFAVINYFLITFSNCIKHKCIYKRKNLKQFFIMKDDCFLILWKYIYEQKINHAFIIIEKAFSKRKLISKLERVMYSLRDKIELSASFFLDYTEEQFEKNFLLS